MIVFFPRTELPPSRSQSTTLLSETVFCIPVRFSQCEPDGPKFWKKCIFIWLFCVQGLFAPNSPALSPVRMSHWQFFTFIRSLKNYVPCQIPCIRNVLNSIHRKVDALRLRKITNGIDFCSKTKTNSSTTTSSIYSIKISFDIFCLCKGGLQNTFLGLDACIAKFISHNWQNAQLVLIFLELETYLSKTTGGICLNQVRNQFYFIWERLRDKP